MTRIAVIRREKCNPVKCAWLCMKKCPINRTGEDCISKSPENKAQIDEVQCTGCGICPRICPFEAISIVNLPEELKNQPIHRYGRNEFALYNLPAPVFGKVVGVIGKNGIGKTTAIKILAGLLKPNLGDFSREASYEQLIEYFKGTEAQKFFEKVKKGEIRISYKPQEVDAIPRQFKGTVKELLSKVDEKKELKKMSELLELGKILDHDITKISGGELQRVAIAATVLKKANLYIFDEPTSYLDIKQRLKMSRFIRGLIDDNTAVLVIEHDLIILDYMTDLIHLMYGRPGVFGVTSMVKTSKIGINVYLEGYLKEENVRFRDYKIKFEKRPPSVVYKRELLTQWPEIKEKLGSFSIEAQPGVIHNRDIIGILGENGIGKTTFVRILAGEIKTQGNLSNLRISYKPQYLGKSDEPVGIFLKHASKYEVQFRPLELKSLMTKTLSQLSGGELQRVSIAKALSEDADLFLLDEPSAYLDVEQRLSMSKIIAEVMDIKGKSCLVVDHDLLFIDYLSEKLIVFEGEPAAHGTAKGPFSMEEGMNHFLQDLNLTFRRDEENNRPRANKVNSQMDSKQKREGKLYYT